MPKTRPHLSITLPKNFTFSTSHGSEPKTPERSQITPEPQLPSSNNLYRLKRRSRPAIASLFDTGGEYLSSSSDLPFLSVEDSVTGHRPSCSRKDYSSLSAATSNSRMQIPQSPHTPQPHHDPASTSVNHTHDPAGLLSRPLSACSIFSDSSDESAQSLISYPAGDGSCTSPESDGPARRLPIYRKNLHTTTNVSGLGLKAHHPRRPKSEYEVWTEEMDWHLWSTYLRYLQDPTMTPFKMLPGVAPPLGVCYRVSREARKSWPINKYRKSASPRLQSPITLQCPAENEIKNETLGISPTIRRTRDGNIAPATPVRTSSIRQWPKSGSSTRRRLRHLCKNRPSIAPHYQRLLQSRTPSPFSSSQSSNTHSRSQLSEMSSPPYDLPATFSTRDIQLSLTTSTSDTMQPDGPLAQFAANPASFQKRDFEDFNEPPVPFASDISPPSDIDVLVSPKSSSHCPRFAPRLGSPFTHHTWGPSHTKQRTRPRMQRNFASDLATIRPSRGSELQIEMGAHLPSLRKRRAVHHLGDSMRHEERTAVDNLSPYHPENPLDSSLESRDFGHKNSERHPLQSLFDTPHDAGISNRSLNFPMGSVDNVAQADQGGESTIVVDHSLDSPFQTRAARRVRKPLEPFVPAGPLRAGVHVNDSLATSELRFATIESPFH